MSQNEQSKGQFREFSLSTFAVDNATSIFLLTFMILLFGIRAYDAMPKEQFPEVIMPKVFIGTPYFGNSAIDIENLVTRPIEKELNSIDGIMDIRSTSIQDYSTVIVEFESDVDIKQALEDVKDAVDKSKKELPDDLNSDPEVIELDVSRMPVVTYNLSGAFSMDELRRYAEHLQDKIENLDEISEVEIKGIQEREVKINVDLLKMQARKISFYDIQSAIGAENMNISGGSIRSDKDQYKWAIRTIGEFKNMDELRNMIVKSVRQNPVYLKDIADVSFDYEERTSYARSGGLPVVSLDVIKRSGENLLIAIDKIKEIVTTAQDKTFPKDLKVAAFNDQSVNTRNEVSNLQNSIISGVILVVLVLLFFLGIRNSLFVGMAIPISMLMGILILNMIGYTLNMVVLFSLILALGLLVDNAIVVVENVYRYMQEGYSGSDAAKYGAGEVALPIIASTATTLAAFLPLAFWPGVMGSFMRYLPITLIVVLSSSLFVALVINPVFTASLMKVDVQSDDINVRRRRFASGIIMGVALLIGAALVHFIFMKDFEYMWLRNLLLIGGGVTLANVLFLRPASFFFQNKALPLLEKGYDAFIKIALWKGLPYLIFGGTFGLLFLAQVLMGVYPPKVVYFPQANPQYVNVFVELPTATDIAVTNDFVKKIEEKVTQAVKPYGKVVEEVLTQIGEGTSDPNEPPEPGRSPNKARITTSFIPTQEREGVSTFEIMNVIRDSVKGFAGAQIMVDKNSDGPPTGKPVNLEIVGDDMGKLVEIGKDVIEYFNENKKRYSELNGIEELKVDVQTNKPELIINIDRKAARNYEVATRDIAFAIRNSIFGVEVYKYKLGEDEYSMFLRAKEEQRYNLSQLMNQTVTFRTPSTGQIHQVPISSVADIKPTRTFSSIKRKDLERSITVASNVVDGYNPNEIVATLQTLMEEYKKTKLPDDYNFEFTGEQQKQAKDMAFLSTSFMVALFSIFIILVAQFNSITAPFIILISVGFSMIGVLFGYIFTGADLVVIMTGMGIISLAGIVVNNAIVLIDYTNLLLSNARKKLGYASNIVLPTEVVKEAIITGGATRLRPVLLTAITTVLGLIPLAIGFNFNFFTLVSHSDPQVFIGGDNVAFWGPMAWTVIYGLTFATFLTLVVIPVMYWIFYSMQTGMLKMFGFKKEYEEITE